MRRALLALAIAAPLAGCALDQHRFERPARLRVGATSHALATDTPGAVARSTTPTTTESLARNARTMSAQFTMATRDETFFAGGEVEAGVLDTERSNFAGAYGIAGVQLVGRVGTVGAELATGWRGLRDDGDDVNSYIAEPRLRAELRFAPQWTLGAVGGATMGERGSWMGGIYLGVHSRAFE
ncbi:MAG TPA: hypothetical protein VFQ53_10660 [Kofleriaceae bacterium]|nr:hypothetical protein [Kofleriaceae bacterium]